MKRILKIAYNLVMLILILFLVAVAGTFLPIPGNYKIFTVQSGSMEPSVKVGSLIFVKKAAEYNVGDIITFKNGKNMVTHRLIEKKGSGPDETFVTKGDANEEADPEATSPQNVFGKAFFTLPYVGYPIGYAQTRVGFILLVIVPSVIIIYEELVNIKLEVLKKFKHRKKKKEGVGPSEIRVERVTVEEDDFPTTSVVGDKPRIASPNFVRRREMKAEPRPETRSERRAEAQREMKRKMKMAPPRRKIV